MARKQERQHKSNVRASVSALRLVSPDNISAAARQAFGIPTQPTDTSDAALAEARANAEATVPAVVEVAKLVAKGWSEEVGNKVLEVWASGYKQAAEAMVLMVRDHQTGKLPFVILQGMFMSHRAMDTSRDFVSEFRAYSKDSGRNIPDHYTGPAIGSEAEWNKVKTDKTRFLSIRINEEGTALVQVIGQRDAGGSASRIVTPEGMAKDYFKLANAIETYCNDMATLYGQKPTTRLQAFKNFRRDILGVIDFKLASHNEEAIAAERKALEQAAKAA